MLFLISQDLVFPDDTTTLDGKDSRDDQKIVKYHWEQVRYWVYKSLVLPNMTQHWPAVKSQAE